MKKIWYVALFFCILFNFFTFGITAEKTSRQQAAGLKFAVSFMQDAHSEALTGRVYLMLSYNNKQEPRFQVRRASGIPFWGQNVEGLKPGDAGIIDENSFGFPLRSISEIPPGEYFIQGFINIYTQYKRADGHTIWMHQDQWEIYMACYGPVGEDGYPKQLWDKLTGEIDPKVAQYWKENFDLRYYLEENWSELGPKLKGKLHIYVGDMDSYYLNNAVKYMEEFLESTKNPYYSGVVEYGAGKPHCWGPGGIELIKLMADYIEKNK